MAHLRAGGYIRKSREDDNAVAYRVEAQKRILPEYARNQGWEYIEFDEAFASASKANLGNLEARNRLEAEIRAGNIDVLLVIELSRLSRDESMQDYVAWLTLCAENKVLLATPSRNLNPAEPSDWMLLMIEGGFSSTEMKILNKRMREGRREAFLKGSFLGGVPPAPYKYDQNLRRIIIDETSLHIHQKIWRLAETHSAQAIANKLGMPNSSVRRALSDKRLDYLQAIRRDPETGALIQCEWDPVMSADQAARIRAARRTRKTNGASTKPKALLSGLDLLKCGYCGRTVKTRLNNKSRKDGTKLRYYGCNANNAKSTCPKSRSMPQVVLDEKVLTNVFNTIGCLDDLMHHWVTSQGSEDYDKQMKLLESEEKSIQQQMQRLVEAVAEGALTNEDVAEKKARVKTDLSEIQSKQKALKSTRVSPPDWDSLLLTREEFEHLDFIDRRRFLSLILEEIKFYDKYAILVYRFPRTESGDRSARIHLPGPRRGTAWGRSPRYKNI